MAKNVNWIRLVKRTGNHWTYFTHPKFPDHEIDLSGAFRVRWPDGEVSIEEIKSLDVQAGEHSGVFLYFEKEYNNMSLIHEMHEVELVDEEVTRRIIDDSRSACAG